MLRAVTGFDHFIILVRNIDEAAVRFASLGFQLTERGHHTHGTCNHTIMLDGNYFEILSVERLQPANERFQRLLAEREGPVSIALATQNSRKLHEELLAMGFPAEAPNNFSRPVRLSDGVQHAHFRTLRIPEGATPSVRMFACEHLTRELVWRSQWQVHPNGARRIMGLILVHHEPESLAPAYSTLFGAAAVKRNADGIVVMLGSVEARFLTPVAFATEYPDQIIPSRPTQAYFAGAICEVDDLNVAAAVLSDSAMRIAKNPRGLVLTPDQACGALLELRANGS